MAQPPPGSGRSSAADNHHDRAVSDSAFDNYRFTFNCSSTGSSKGSFIEPDVSFTLFFSVKRNDLFTEETPEHHKVRPLMDVSQT